MKKKKQTPGKGSHDGGDFPVDTLGIPILVEVINSSPAADAEEELEQSIIKIREAKPEPSPPETLSGQEQPSTTATEIDLDQITDRITKSITGEIMASIEPIVRDKVHLALRMYQSGLGQFPDKRNEGKTGPD